jgi:hypothetical protein
MTLNELKVDNISQQNVVFHTESLHKKDEVIHSHLTEPPLPPSLPPKTSQGEITCDINESSDCGNTGIIEIYQAEKQEYSYEDYSRDYANPPRRPNMRGKDTDQDKITKEEVCSVIVSGRILAN